MLRRGRTSTIVWAVLASLLGAAALVTAYWPTRDRMDAGAPPKSTAVLRQSLRRLSASPALTYDMRLEVASDPGRASDFSVQGSTAARTTITTGTVELSNDGPEEDRNLRFLLEGRRLFLLEETQGGSEPWREVDFLATLRSARDDDARLLALAVQRPLEFASILLGVNSAEDVGSERLIDGIATRYRARVSFNAARGRIDSTIDPDVLEVVTRRIDGDEIELDAWVDEDRRLRALSLSGSLDGGRDYSLRLNFSALDEAAATTLPSRTTVVDALDLDELVVLGRVGHLSPSGA